MLHSAQPDCLQPPRAGSKRFLCRTERVAARSICSSHSPRRLNLRAAHPPTPAGKAAAARRRGRLPAPWTLRARQAACAPPHKKQGLHQLACCALKGAPTALLTRCCPAGIGRHSLLPAWLWHGPPGGITEPWYCTAALRSRNPSRQLRSSPPAAPAPHRPPSVPARDGTCGGADQHQRHVQRGLRVRPTLCSIQPCSQLG